MIISIFASVGCQNLWDELIVKNEIKQLKEKYGSDTEFHIFTYDKNHKFLEDKNILYRWYFPDGVKNPLNIFSNLISYFRFRSIVKKSDLIVIWWGGLFFDSEISNKKNPLKLWKWRVNFFRAFNKQILFNAVGLNIQDENNYKYIKQIFSWDVEISVRDKYSLNLLKSLDIDSTIVLDPVFYDNNNVSEVFESNCMIDSRRSFDFEAWEIDKLNLKWKLVWLALRKWYLIELQWNNKQSYLDKLETAKINQIIKTIKLRWWDVILLPHSFHKKDVLSNDYLFLNKFDAKIANSMEEVYEYYSSEKIDMCISMRLHSIILSMVYGIPFIALSYTKKTDEILAKYIMEVN